MLWILTIIGVPIIFFPAFMLDLFKGGRTDANGHSLDKYGDRKNYTKKQMEYISTMDDIKRLEYGISEEVYRRSLKSAKRQKVLQELKDKLKCNQSN